MPITYINIASTTLSSNQATITFNSIPSTYTDLVLRWSARTNRSGWPYDQFSLRLNNVTTVNNYSYTQLNASSTSAGTSRGANTSDIVHVAATAVTATTNAFSSGEIYIPNYTSATSKPMTMFTASESDSSTNWYITRTAGQFIPTSTISRIDFYPTFGASIIADSTFYLYGIKKN
jgi:hypothetical protein